MIRLVETLRSLTGWRAAGVALLLGCTFALALPPLNLWPAMFVALPAFLLLLEAAGESSLPRNFGLGWAFGSGYFLVALHWIGFAFLVDAANDLWMMPFAVGGLAAAMAS